MQYKSTAVFVWKWYVVSTVAYSTSIYNNYHKSLQKQFAIILMIYPLKVSTTNVEMWAMIIGRKIKYSSWNKLLSKVDERKLSQFKTPYSFVQTKFIIIVKAAGSVWYSTINKEENIRKNNSILDIFILVKINIIEPVLIDIKLGKIEPSHTIFFYR